MWGGYHYNQNCFNCLDHNDSQPVPFNMSVLPLYLEEGANDATVISCSSDTYIGDFYVCYSKNLDKLEKLDIDNRHCCYCSNEASDNCIQKFRNWKTLYTKRQNTSTCLLNLQHATEEDSGFYQCRVYELIKHPCKRHYGTTYNLSVSAKPSNDSKPHAHSVVIIVSIVSVISGLLVIFIACAVICFVHKQRSRASQSK